MALTLFSRTSLTPNHRIITPSLLSAVPTKRAINSQLGSTKWAHRSMAYSRIGHTPLPLFFEDLLYYAHRKNNLKKELDMIKEQRKLIQENQKRLVKMTEEQRNPIQENQLRVSNRTLYMTEEQRNPFQEHQIRKRLLNITEKLKPIQENQKRAFYVTLEQPNPIQEHQKRAFDMTEEQQKPIQENQKVGIVSGLSKWDFKDNPKKKPRDRKSKHWLELQQRVKAQFPNPNHAPMSPTEHVQSLPDTFLKARAEDLKKSDEQSRLIPAEYGIFGSNSTDSSSNSPNNVKKSVSRNQISTDNCQIFDRRGFSTMSRATRFKRNENSRDDFDVKFDALSPKFAGKKEKVKSLSNVNGVIRSKVLLKFGKNDSSTEEKDSEDEKIEIEGDEKIKGWMDMRKTGSTASLGNRLNKSVNRNDTDEELFYPPLKISVVSKRKSIENVMEVKLEPHDSIYSGKRFDESPLTLKALSESGIVKMTLAQDATLSECLNGKDALVKAKTGTEKSMAILVGTLSDREQYIYRLGRTGREGKGLNLIAPWERYFLDELKDLPLGPIPVPDLDSKVKLEGDLPMAKIDTSIKEAAYQAWLGYYN